MDAMLAVSNTSQVVNRDSAEELNNLIQQQIAGCLEALQNAKVPSIEEIFNYLTDMHIMAGVLLAVVGALYLLLGWKFFKVMLIANAAVLGAMAGGMAMVNLGYENKWWIGLLTGGIVLAILAWPLMRVFLALIGAVLGAGAGFVLFEAIVIAAGRENLLGFAWTGSVAGAIGMFVVIFIKFKFCVAAMTALQGSVMLVNGLLCIALKFEKSETYIRDLVFDNPELFPLGLFIVMLAGLVFQLTKSSKAKKKPKPAAQPG